VDIEPLAPEPFDIAADDMLPEDVLVPVDMLPLVADWAKASVAETTLSIAAATANFDNVFITYLAF
jgi:hypothetical protein